jgi:all-trans-8'-apo-beta-carotenal 15,15'-oxygenase
MSSAQTKPGGRPLQPGQPLREFEGLNSEHDYELTTEFGAVPQGLRGTLYRNGMGSWESGGSPVGHIFDGDGMVSMFVFSEGRVRFRNRYVRTDHYRRGNNSMRGPAGRGTGTLRGDGGLLANAFRWPLSNQANTNVVLHAGQLLALWEAGKPHSLEPDTLVTNGLHDYAGRLRGVGSFSAHPKIDHRTGELFNFGTAFFPVPGLLAYRVDRTGTLTKLTQLPMFPPVLNHDVGLTDRYLVFVIDPIVVSPTAMLPVIAGLKPLHEAIGFQPALGTKIVLVPRGGGPNIHAHTDALLHFHLANCYDDRDDTVIELVRYTDDFETMWAMFRNGFNKVRLNPAFGGPLTRLRVTKTGRVVREDLTDRRAEFPQIDPRFTGRPNRFSYLVAIPDRIAADAAPVDVRSTGLDRDQPNLKMDVLEGGITTIDHERGTESIHITPGYGSTCEPAFAPRFPDASEGDGWLLAIEYLRDEHRSRLVVLDAAAPERGPLYIGGLRHHLPIGLHGMFTSRVASLPTTD